MSFCNTNFTPWWSIWVLHIIKLSSSEHTFTFCPVTQCAPKIITILIFVLHIQPWKENILHENILKPVLNRATWPWSKRHKDFELYRKPPVVLGPVPPITIHLAGKSLIILNQINVFFYRTLHYMGKSLWTSDHHTYVNVWNIPFQI